MQRRTAFLTARAAVLALAAGAAACSTTIPSQRPSAALPSDEFQITVKETRAKLEIPTEREKFMLTFEERAAVEAFAIAHRDRGHGVLTIALPGDEDETTEEAVLTAKEARDIINAQGLDYYYIKGARYDSRGVPGEPIVLFFSMYEAEGPDCHREWRDFNITWSGSNTYNFGCASQANLAAMVADPGDLLGPRGEDHPDELRRYEALDRYRRGESTITQRSQQETTAISQAVE